jgi:hypothetical protein
MYGSIQPKDPGETVWTTDFPHSDFGKSDFKKVMQNGTFGNDKVITNKGFRPSYGIS